VTQQPPESGLYNTTAGVLTVYADLVCPFAALVLHGLRSARERLGIAVAFDLRAYPLELVDGRPHDLALHEAEKPAVAAVEPTLHWKRWRAEPSTWPVTTLLALEAVEAAKRPEVGGLVASDELDEALRRALFLDSRCIALLPVIREVAEECPSMDRAALCTDLRAGAGRAGVMASLGYAERGAVKGSPHVFTPDGQDWLTPGIELEYRGDYATVTGYHPQVYGEILRACNP
jgi:predicted DsbA family dithiol-disulfide isomerase